jgi:CRP-like cAMP-binding protein
MPKPLAVFGLAGSSEIIEREAAASDEIETQAALSTALVSVFRGKLCDLILPRRKPTAFSKGEIIYSAGDRRRMFYFLQNGFVKVGAITSNGSELIYDVRKGGDVVGELCVLEEERPDRAVALEATSAIGVPFDEVKTLLATEPGLAATLIEVFCTALKQAYLQVNTLATDDIVHRLAKLLLSLTEKMGHRSGPLMEIPIYLTQGEISQMVAARRERVSTALNVLRRRGMVQYTPRGNLLVHVEGLAGLAEG